MKCHKGISIKPKLHNSFEKSVYFNSENGMSLLFLSLNTIIIITFVNLFYQYTYSHKNLWRY